MCGMNTSNTSICLNFYAQLVRAGKFGVSRSWLEELYEDHKGKRPESKTIYRIIEEIELSMSRLAVRIVKRKINGTTKYFLESDWAVDTNDGISRFFVALLPNYCQAHMQ